MTLAKYAGVHAILIESQGRCPEESEVIPCHEILLRACMDCTNRSELPIV
jgi:hypothetical protein